MSDLSSMNLKGTLEKIGTVRVVDSRVIIQDVSNRLQVGTAGGYSKHGSTSDSEGATGSEVGTVTCHYESYPPRNKHVTNRPVCTTVEKMLLLCKPVTSSARAKR
jgi:hypothetical protein